MADAARPLKKGKAPRAVEANAGQGEFALAAAPPLAGETAEANKPARKATAEQMAQKQREISISEFFTKNRHLLGFDNPSKALLTTVKEAVDNSLDACEEAGILPEIMVEIHELGGDRFQAAIEDNGPGIVRAQVPKVFGKLLYGSKFHRLKQSRGQQGIGISAAVMYGQLTTGKAAVVVSKTGKGRPGHRFEIALDTRKNAPDVQSDSEVELTKDHGTRVEIEMAANYVNGQRSLLRYLEQTALANPHAAFTYVRPHQPPLQFPRAVDVPPKEAIEIKPHPQGLELGALILMLAETKSRSLQDFFHDEFSRVSETIATDICKAAGLKDSLAPHRVDRAQAEKLHVAIAAQKLMAPPLNCLSPIGDELMRKGLINFLSVTETPLDEEGLEAAPPADPPKAEAAAVPAEKEEGVTAGEEKIKGKTFFVSTVTRPPKVYRGNPFQVEVGLAYGGDWPADKSVELYRFANRVPLLFQRGACGLTESIVRTDWRNYLLSHPKGALPVGPMVLLVHIASVWVPFTSESKEAVAHYPEILKEVQLAAQECGRRLAAHIRKRQHADYELKRRSIFEMYIEEVSQSLSKLTEKAEDPIRKSLLKLSATFTGADADADAALALVAAKTATSPKAKAKTKPAREDS